MATILLDKMKKELRISSPDFDEEITNLIEAGKLDLQGAGVSVIDEGDPRIQHVLGLFCKAFFGSENPEMVKYEVMYTKLKLNLCYTIGGGDGS